MKAMFFVRNLDSREHSATVKVISYLEMSCESSFSVYLGDRAERPNVTRKTAERRSCTFLSVLNLFQIRRAVSWESIKNGTLLQPAKWWQHCLHWLWVYFGSMQTSDCIITALALAMCYWLKSWQTHRSWADWPGSAPNSLIFQDMQAIWHRNPKDFKTFYKYQVWKKKMFLLSPLPQQPLLIFYCTPNTWVLTLPEQAYFLIEVGLHSPAILLQSTVWSSLNAWQQFIGWTGKYLHVDKESLLYFLTPT